MERYDISLTHPANTGAAIQSAQTVPFPLNDKAFLSQESLLPRRGIARGTQSPGDTGAQRLSRLSLREFSDRLALLTELEVPCVAHITTGNRHGIVRKIEVDADRLHLLGENLSLHLHRNNIDAVWLVKQIGGEEPGMGLEIFDRTGRLIARLLGIQDRVGAAVWQDVMGNPSFAMA